MRMSYEEAVKKGWVAPQDVPASAKPAKGSKREAEGDEQVLVVKQFRVLFPSVGRLLIHIPNGGSRKNAFEGWRLKEQGVRAGVSDLLLPVARGGFFGLWIEFKAAPPNNAVVSDGQREWLAEMEQQGYAGHICLGDAAALAVLTDYMALKPTVARISKPKKLEK